MYDGLLNICVKTKVKSLKAWKLDWTAVRAWVCQFDGLSDCVCVTGCDDGRFGRDCAELCECDGALCDPTTGWCLCPSGKTGERCEKGAHTHTHLAHFTQTLINLASNFQSFIFSLSLWPQVLRSRLFFPVSVCTRRPVWPAHRSLLVSSHLDGTHLWGRWGSVCVWTYKTVPRS